MRKYLALLLCLVLAVCPVTGAFAGVYLPSSLKVIESEAFAGDTSVSGVVTLPGSVTTIGSGAFRDTNLFALRTSTSVRSIGSDILAGTDAVYALVPSSVASLEAGALSGAANIITDSMNPVYYWARNNGIPVYTIGQVNIHDGFYYAYNDEMTEVTLLFAVNDSVSGEVTVPAYVDGRKVTAIGAYGFTRLSGVTKINVPQGIYISDETVNWPDAEISAYTYTADPILPDDETAVELGLNYSELTMNPGEIVAFSLNEYVESDRWIVDFTDESLLQPYGIVEGHEINFEALEVGTTTLTLSRVDPEGVIHYGVCYINVVEPKVELNLTVDSLNMTLGDIIGINHNFITSGMSDEVNYTLEISDESVVASYRENSSVIEAVGVGETDVTMTIEQYGATDSKTLHVTVTEPELTFESNIISGYTGHSYQAVLTSEVPEGATVEWTSALPELASVDENGLITCHSTGDSYYGDVAITCTVTCADGTVKTGTITMSFLEITMEWTEVEEPYTITSGEEWRKLDIGVHQWYWTDDADTWSYTAVSSDESVLSFVNDPSVRWAVATHKPGTVTVTLTANFLDLTTTREYTIEVIAPSMQAYLSDSYFEGIVGDQWGVDHWYESEIAVSESFSSSDPSVATVDARGLIVAVGPGEADITYTISGGGVSSSASVHVVVYGINASFPQDEYTINVGEAITLVPQIDLPEGVTANYNDFYFSSLDGEIASVDHLGNVVGNSAGTVTITFAVDLDGIANCDWAHAYATAVVHVVDPDAMITLSESSLAFVPGETKTVTATFAKEPESVTWWSSNSEAYSVEDGVITAGRHNSYPCHDLIICSAVIDGETYEARLQVSTKQAAASLSNGTDWIGMSVGEETWPTLLLDHRR